MRTSRGCGTFVQHKHRRCKHAVSARSRSQGELTPGIVSLALGSRCNSVKFKADEHRESLMFAWYKAAKQRAGGFQEQLKARQPPGPCWTAPARRPGSRAVPCQPIARPTGSRKRTQTER